jgi:hypothetical protein
MPVISVALAIELPPSDWLEEGMRLVCYIRWVDYQAWIGSKTAPFSFLEFVIVFAGTIQKEANMSVKPNRQVFGGILCVSRAMGLVLITLAILGLPQVRYLTGRLATGFGLITSIALGLAGAVWLLGVQVFLHFFDRYLSRN